ncbi:MAG TPA: class I SAM-dependent methyltransferase [Anaerolineales bacterium]|nr:class I SAM-dependent methyltransferase [Anaerolineales bacterium]
MKHPDHVNLLRPADLSLGGTWADFGAGTGAFTLALRELVGTDAEIYAVDRTGGDLRQLQEAYHKRFGDTGKLHLVVGDFTRPLDLPPLDGMLMANSLHYFRDDATSGKASGTVTPPDPGSHLGEHLRDKLSLLRYFGSFLKPGGMFLLVEYNVDSGNPWVPYPLSFQTWQRLAKEAGFTEPRLLTTHPSSFLREFYSAVCYREA